MIGDATLFQRADNIEAGWCAVQPILDAWANNPPRDFPNYIAGSNGPAQPTTAGARRSRVASAGLSRDNEGPMESGRSRWVLADVDGTLVNEQKVLTKRAQAAVQHLRQAGIRFAITSGRPPRAWPGCSMT